MIERVTQSPLDPYMSCIDAMSDKLVALERRVAELEAALLSLHREWDREASVSTRPMRVGGGRR